MLSTDNNDWWRIQAEKSLEAMYQRALAAEAEVEHLLEALEGIFNAWPRHLFNVPQEAVDRFIAAMDEAQALVNAARTEKP